MFAYKPDKCLVPIKVWADRDQVEQGALEQLENTAQLPFAFHHVAGMPDIHQGYGAPIGGVFASEGYVVPHFVGVDIGCGMCFIETNIPVSLLQVETPSAGTLAKAIVGNIMRNVPTGFAHHNAKQKCAALDKTWHWEYGVGDRGEDVQIFEKDFAGHLLMGEIEDGYFQVGTLGGGNHFIELQTDENGMLCIMLHSGSRNFGKKICDYYNDVAKTYNAVWKSSVDPKWDLAFLPSESPEGKGYIAWMNLALDFAMENRQAMMEQIKSVVMNMVKKYTDFTGIVLGEQINAHHNYAVIEHHFGKNVWIHRKGAIRAREGDIGIIPGAMGSYSYIVKGKGHPESFHSASHGAGRCMGRKEAMRRFETQAVVEDLKAQGVTVGKANMDDIADESRFAYKNIDTVIANEADLVEPIKKLKTVCVIKG